ncbi:hypothetical protein BKA70DRAFT_1165999 [Coprinopsis sp. MPI-PUGE-AT-0042]|nr:hypothetical protein BKA70DRAFT_1165999 [Coprinopsis sp. MPI-PUGE-AT-0042]
MPVEIISIVYGNTKIVDPTVINRFRDAIAHRKTIDISNHNLGGDPLRGVRKTFVIEYKNSDNCDCSVVKRRRMTEREHLDFNWDITSVTYGGTPIEAHAHTYETLFWGLDHHEGVPISNQTAGFDPCRGTLKTMNVTYTHGSHSYHTSAAERTDLTFPMRQCH